MTPTPATGDVLFSLGKIAILCTAGFAVNIWFFYRFIVPLEKP